MNEFMNEGENTGSAFITSVDNTGAKITEDA
jgi:hypothetical protein